MTTILTGNVIAQDKELRHLSGILVEEGYTVVRQGLKIQVIDKHGKKTKWMEAFPLRGYVRRLLSTQTAMTIAFHKVGIK